MSDEIQDWFIKDEKEIVSDVWNNASYRRQKLKLKASKQIEVLTKEHKSIAMRRKMLLNAFIDKEKQQRQGK